jgi:hypothetical protein
LKTAHGALIFLIASSLPFAAAAIDECGKAACDAQKGTWSCTQQAIPGDGSVHDFAVRNANRNAAFVCGQAMAMRQGLDTGFVASCMLNPEQPASIDNSYERRCATPSDDMRVEACVEAGGSNPILSCRYVNTGARPKTVQLCGCWK